MIISLSLSLFYQKRGFVPTVKRERKEKGRREKEKEREGEKGKRSKDLIPSSFLLQEKKN